jgi:hypothetical protein
LLAEKTGTKEEPERDLSQTVDKDGYVSLLSIEDSTAQFELFDRFHFINFFF